MKITKTQLKQIIKEEIQQVNEAPAGILDEIYSALTSLADGLDDVNERLNRLEEKDYETN